MEGLSPPIGGWFWTGCSSWVAGFFFYFATEDITSSTIFGR